MVEVARIADASGVDQLLVPDHVAIGPRTDRYPYGRFPYPPEEPWLEPTLVLAAMAAATERLRLGTGVLIAPLRPALLLAKTLATLDVLSRGRLDVGIGLGWQPEEIEACGVPFAERSARLDDALRACRALWRDAPASCDAPTAAFDDLFCLPHPVQAGGIPLWFGGPAAGRNAARIAEYGVGWIPIAGADGAALASGIARLRDAFRAAGRDPAELRVRAAPPIARGPDGRPDLERTLAGCDGLADLGATLASFPLAAFCRDRSEMRPFLEALGRR